MKEIAEEKSHKILVSSVLSLLLFMSTLTVGVTNAEAITNSANNMDNLYNQDASPAFFTNEENKPQSNIVPVKGAIRAEGGYTIDPSEAIDPRTAKVEGFPIVIPGGAGVKSVFDGRYFQPAMVNVVAGNVITWINNDGAAHTATARDLSFDTGLIPASHSASVVMTVEPGTVIPYFCVLHPWMSGAINVISEEAAERAEELLTPNDTDTKRSVPFVAQDQIITAPEILSVENGAIADGDNTTTTAEADVSNTTTDMATTNTTSATTTNTSNIDTTGTDSSVSSPLTRVSYPSSEEPSISPISAITPSLTTISTLTSNSASDNNTTATSPSSTVEARTTEGERNDYEGKTITNVTKPEPKVTTEFPDSLDPVVIKKLPLKAGQQDNGDTATTTTTTTTTTPTTNTTTKTATGFEEENKDNWITANHDIFYTRNSSQTTINQDNINDLQIKWILDNPEPIENPPIIIGSAGYAQDNGGNIIAFNATTGENQWRVDTGRGGLMHGLTYDDGVIFAGTGGNATVVALNATNGEKFWETAPLGPKNLGYGVGVPPLVWNDYVIVGSAGGDFPPHPGVVQGNVTALNRANGEVLWNLQTTAGEWVSPERVPPNGGGTVWSGLAFDPETGTLYTTTGNATPDFNGTSRMMPNWYTNSIIAVNITNGKMLWATPLIEYGTVFDVELPDTHDWDASWAATISKVKYDNGTEKKMVIGTDKMGNVLAVDAQTGDEIWWHTLGTTYRTWAEPEPMGSGEVWPGTQYGVEAYHAVDNGTAYFSTSSMGVEYFVDGLAGYVVPLFDSIDNALGNGTVTAIDLKTGDIKWQHPTPFPTWVSPLVTNGLVFSGHVTEIGQPYKYNAFGAPQEAPLLPNGIIFALDKETGEKIWEMKVGSPIGIGGSSIGNGMLYVPTTVESGIAITKTGSIIAFGLPSSQQDGGMTTTPTTASEQTTVTTEEEGQEQEQEIQRLIQQSEPQQERP